MTKRFLTIEARERFRIANEPAIAAAARVGESARQLQELGKQLEVLQRAQEEERLTLAAREDDLRLAQEARDAFLAEFSAEDRQALIQGRRPPEVAPATAAASQTREPRKPTDAAAMLGAVGVVRSL